MLFWHQSWPPPSLSLSSKASFFSSVPNQTLSPPHAILKNSPIPFIVFLPNLINMHESSQKFILIIKYSEYILHTRTNKIHSSYITSNTQIWAIKQKKPNYIHLINPVAPFPCLLLANVLLCLLIFPRCQAETCYFSDKWLTLTCFMSPLDTIPCHCSLTLWHSTDTISFRITPLGLPSSS